VYCLISCRRAADVGLLCDHHRLRLAAMLDPRQRGDVFVKPGETRTPPSIPVLYGLLSTERGIHGPMAVGHDALGPRSPADDAAVVLRDERSTSSVYGPEDRQRQPDAPIAVLLQLAIRVMRERGAPERRPASTVEGLASWLHGQTDWLAAQPWVAATYEQLRTVQAALRHAVGDPAPRRLGACWVLVGDDGHPNPEGKWRCGTALYMPEQPPRAPDEPIALPAIHCGGCGWHYTGAELVQLGRMLEQQEAS